MNETEALKHVLETLCKKYDFIDEAVSTLDKDDPKFVHLTNSQNRIARSILATISLMRDPKREIMLDRAADARHDVAKLAKEIVEQDEKLHGGKKNMMTIKSKRGGSKKCHMVRKTGSRSR
jgi:hypothetical protein